MNFSHTLTLMAPYDLSNKAVHKAVIIPNYCRLDGTIQHFNCNPAIANAFHVAIATDQECFTLAECPDFKTADAFIKIIDSLLQSFKS